jgi:hypothetical protein
VKRILLEYTSDYSFEAMRKVNPVRLVEGALDLFKLLYGNYYHYSLKG